MLKSPYIDKYSPTKNEISDRHSQLGLLGVTLVDDGHEVLKERRANAHMAGPHPPPRRPPSPRGGRGRPGGHEGQPDGVGKAGSGVEGA